MSNTNSSLKARSDRLYRLWKDIDSLSKLVLPKNPNEDQQEYDKKIMLVKKYLQEIRDKRLVEAV